MIRTYEDSRAGDAATRTPNALLPSALWVEERCSILKVFRWALNTSRMTTRLTTRIEPIPHLLGIAKGRGAPNKIRGCHHWLELASAEHDSSLSPEEDLLCVSPPSESIGTSGFLPLPGYILSTSLSLNAVFSFRESDIIVVLQHNVGESLLLHRKQYGSPLRFR